MYKKIIKKKNHFTKKRKNILKINVCSENEYFITSWYLYRESRNCFASVLRFFNYIFKLEKKVSKSIKSLVTSNKLIFFIAFYFVELNCIPFCIDWILLCSLFVRLFWLCFFSFLLLLLYKRWRWPFKAFLFFFFNSLFKEFIWFAPNLSSTFWDLLIHQRLN